MPPVIDYQTPRNTPKHLVLRALTTCCLLSVAGVKTTALFMIMFSQDRDLRFSVISVAIYVLLALTTLADVALVWIMWRQWAARKRWIWPLPVFVSVPLNVLVGVLYIRTKFWWHGGASSYMALGLAILAIASAVFITVTCITADRDRRMLRLIPRPQDERLRPHCSSISGRRPQ